VGRPKKQFPIDRTESDLPSPRSDVLRLRDQTGLYESVCNGRNAVRILPVVPPCPTGNWSRAGTDLIDGANVGDATRSADHDVVQSPGFIGNPTEPVSEPENFSTNDESAWGKLKVK